MKTKKHWLIVMFFVLFGCVEHVYAEDTYTCTANSIPAFYCGRISDDLKTQYGCTITSSGLGCSGTCTKLTEQIINQYGELLNITINDCTKNASTTPDPPSTDTLVTKPTAASACKTGLVANGSAQTLTNTPPQGVTYSNNVQTAAGIYTILANLESGYVWSDNSNESVEFQCTLDQQQSGDDSGHTEEPAKTKVAKPNSKDNCNVVYYTGSEQVLTTGTTAGYTLSGNKGTAVGEYQITASLSSGYVWDDNSSSNVTFTCSILESQVVDGKIIKPTATNYCKNNLIYNGQEQVLTISSVQGFTLVNNKGTDANTYSVKAILDDGFKWNDDSTEDVTFQCVIEKATPVVTVNPTRLTLRIGNSSNLNYQASIPGEFSVASSDEGVVTASIGTGNTIIVNSVAKGTAYVRVKFTPTNAANYNEVIEPVSVAVSDINQPTSKDDLPNNPETGTMTILVVFVAQFLSLGYIIWYVKRRKGMVN